MKSWLSALACCALLLSCLDTLWASAIHDAAERGDLAGIKVLLRYDADLVNEVDEEDYTPLHVAVIDDRVPVVLYLLERGADTSLVNADGFTPLQHAAFFQKKASAYTIIRHTRKCDMHSAAMLGDAVLVRKLLDVDPRLVNEPDINGDTPLWQAAHFGFADVAQVLIDKGADVNAAGPANHCPLRRAIAKGHTNVVKLLLDNGADVSGTGRFPTSLLDSTLYPDEDKEMAQLLMAHGAEISIFYATFHKDMARVRELLDADPYLVNAAGPSSYTPLHIAADRKALDIAKLLIARKAEPNVGYPETTPLSVASRAGYIDMVTLLISKGAKVNFPIHEYSPLHWAARLEDTDVARYLIQWDADVNALDAFDATPLHGAASAEMAKLLIGKGANADACDTSGYTPLLRAVQRKNEELAKLLIAEGANVNAVTDHRWTPLFFAVRDGSKQLAQSLIAGGADVNAADADGSTPLFIAVKEGHKDLAELLISAGAKLDAKDKRGATPTIWAMVKSDGEMLALLVPLSVEDLQPLVLQGPVSLGGP